MTPDEQNALPELRYEPLIASLEPLFLLATRAHSRAAINRAESTKPSFLLATNLDFLHPIWGELDLEFPHGTEAVCREGQLRI
jgi:hypothetical protein